MYAHNHVPQPHQNAAQNNRAAVAPVAVGHEAPDERCKKDQSNKSAVEVRGFFFGEGKSGFHIFEIKGENANHEVIAEALPHFGKKKIGQRLGVIFPHSSTEIFQNELLKNLGRLVDLLLQIGGQAKQDGRCYAGHNQKQHEKFEEIGNLESQKNGVCHRSRCFS